jgi:hypothetical protein
MAQLVQQMQMLLNVIQQIQLQIRQVDVATKRTDLIKIVIERTRPERTVDTNQRVLMAAAY